MVATHTKIWEGKKNSFIGKSFDIIICIYATMVVFAQMRTHIFFSSSFKFQKCPSLKRGQMNNFVFNYVGCVIMVEAIMETLLMRLRMPKIKANICICSLLFFKFKRRVFLPQSSLENFFFGHSHRRISSYNTEM